MLQAASENLLSGGICMTFTDQLRKENDDIFELIFEHPFVTGIGKGDVPKKALEHYIKADFGYLTAFMQLYGIALSKSAAREEIGFFNEKINFVLHSESHPHHNFCDHIGVGYEELQGYALPPTADHYVKHMFYHAHTGSLGELIAALLPCPWTYLEIGEQLTARYKPSEEHPFYPWISFYANPSIVELEMIHQLNKIADRAGIAEKEKMRDAFRKSCQLELGFWEMSYTCEAWPSKERAQIK